MPIYEYQCETCGFEFEELVRGSDTVACPHCQSAGVRRKMSSFAKTSGGSSGGETYTASASGSKCGGCSGGNCSCCHH